MAFPSSQVWMWELDHKEGWESKNCFFTVVLDKAFGSPLVCKDIKFVNHKGNQPWIFTGRTDAEAEAPIFWPSDVKCWLIRKDPDYGKDWRQEEKGTKRIRCLDGITVLMIWIWASSGDGDGQKSLAYYRPWGRRAGCNWVTEKYHGISWLRNQTYTSHNNCIGNWFLYHWAIKKAEHQRFGAFWLWCWRRLLRVPWRARRSNQSILKEINSNYSWKEWCWSWNPNTLAISCEELTHCKKPDAGADWREKEKGAAEDEMVT